MLLLETKETFNENECHMDLTKKKKKFIYCYIARKYCNYLAYFDS